MDIQTNTRRVKEKKKIGLKIVLERKSNVSKILQFFQNFLIDTRKNKEIERKEKVFEEE